MRQQLDNERHAHTRTKDDDKASPALLQTNHVASIKAGNSLVLLVCFVLASVRTLKQKHTIKHRALFIIVLHKVPDSFPLCASFSLCALFICNAMEWKREMNKEQKENHHTDLVA